MPFLTMRSAVLAAMETVEGTNAAPVAASHAIVTIGQPTFNYDAEDLTRDIPSTTLSQMGTVPGLRSATLNFTTEFKGPGRAVSNQASALREDPLFRACGMVPLFSATSCVYTFSTAAATAAASATATIYSHIDGILHVMKAARGGFNIGLEDGQFAKIDWTFKGIFAPISAATSVGDIADVALPAATYDALAIVPPAVMGATFTVHGYQAICQALNLSIGNDVQMRPSISGTGGYAGGYIGARPVTGTINPEAVNRSVFDFFYKWQQGTTGALVFEHKDAATAWTTIRLDAPALQFKIPKWGDRNGLRIFDIDVNLLRSGVSAGDDELTVMFKQ